MKFIKNLLGIIAIVMFLVTIPSVAFAEDNSSINVIEEVNATVNSTVEDVVDETDMKIITTPEGAKVRLEQLKIAIESHIESANLIIDELEADNASVDYDRLNEITQEFEDLLSQIDELDLDQSADILASEFVSVKADAISLSQEFRLLVKDSVQEQKKAEIRERVQEKKEEVKAKNEQKLAQLRNQYNAKKIGGLAAQLGLNATELQAQVQAGELTLAQVRSQIQEKYNSLNESEKAQVRSQIAEEAQKAKVEAKQKLEQKRSEVEAKLEQKRVEIQERFEANVAKRLDRLNNSNLSDDQKAKIKEDIEDRAAEIVDKKLNKTGGSK